MELRRYATVLARWWWLLCLAAALAGGVAWYITRLQPRFYRATATLLVSQGRDLQGVSYDSLLTSESLTRTYAQLVTTPPVLGAAARQLGIADPATLEESVGARIVRDTQLLEIRAEAEQPETARAIANTVAETFIAQRLADQAGQASAAREALRRQAADLDREIADTARALDAARQSADPQAVEVGRLQNLLAEQQTTRSQLLRSDLDLALAGARTSNSLALVVPAQAPVEPFSPNLRQNVVLATLVGLLLALAVVFLVEYLDDTVKSEASVREATGLSTLGLIARARGGRQTSPRLFEDAAGRSSLGEAYRVLRANVDFSWAGQRGRSIVVTSANPREGKTTTVANLGLVLAEDRRRVVLVDADLRRPALHRVFGVEATRGLSNLLSDPALQVEGCLQPTANPGLNLLVAGPIPPNPSELLGSPRFGEVLGELGRVADVVLVDSPPALHVVDPAVIANRVDGVIVVAEVGVTRIEALRRVADVLERSTARRLGVVLNKVAERSADYYYHYYHAGKDGAPNGTARRAKAAGGR